ncbi:DUF308 domain-containing protein [Methanogenium sp. S4BF]|uniref:HdeD family acid-resistance protein n=1 Tax=Methanogenium sp. S4BF TaxID=1789226 RepID=UPI0024166BE3|nr:DUF308 domain-containing protein [Methanogenium sp. S4BF]WFN34566.1 DUF308 domain-containing protein [Methanogenium sp. S4BF]
MEFEQTDMIVSGDELISAAWWVFILQGLFGIIFGGLAMLFPALIVELLAILLGIIIVLYSLSIIAQSIVSKDSGGRKVLMVILGVIGIVIGILALMNMVVLGLTIAFMLGLWAFISGFSSLFTALTATEYHWYRILFFVVGILFLVFGIYVIIYPLALTAAFIWVMGLFSLIIGIATIVLGFIMQAEMKKALNESGM